MIEWNDSYKTGHSLIDTQHKRLFEIGAEAEALLKDEFAFDKYDDIMTVMNELKEYTLYHFKCEEGLMEASNYKGINAHKLIHIGFIAKIEDVLNRDIDENQSAVLLQTLDFVIEWIIDHIKETDCYMVTELTV